MASKSTSICLSWIVCLLRNTNFLSPRHVVLLYIKETNVSSVIPRSYCSDFNTASVDFYRTQCAIPYTQCVSVLSIHVRKKHLSTSLFIQQTEFFCLSLRVIVWKPTIEIRYFHLKDWFLSGQPSEVRGLLTYIAFIKLIQNGMEIHIIRMHPDVNEYCDHFVLIGHWLRRFRVSPSAWSKSPTLFDLTHKNCLRIFLIFETPWPIQSRSKSMSTWNKW